MKILLKACCLISLPLLPLSSVAAAAVVAATVAVAATSAVVVVGNLLDICCSNVRSVAS